MKICHECSVKFAPICPGLSINGMFLNLIASVTICYVSLLVDVESGLPLDCQVKF